MHDILIELDEFRRNYLRYNTVFPTISSMNLRRLQRFALSLVLIEFIYWVFEILLSPQPFVWVYSLDYIIHGAIGILAVLCVYITSSYLFNQRQPSLHRLDMMTWLFALVTLSAYALLASIHLSEHMQMGWFVLVSIFSATTLYIRWPTSLFTYTLAYLVFILSFIFVHRAFDYMWMYLLFSMLIYVFVLFVSSFNYTNQALHIYKHNELMKVKEELEHQMRHDRLTGVYNRAFFHEILERELDMIYRHKHPGALILLDIDVFKVINDAYGHVIGDEVLKHISKKVMLSLRVSDIFARWGGEEFALFASFVSEAEVTEICARIQKTLKEEPLQIDYARIELTVSMGIAMVTPDQLRGVDEYITIAEEALAKAKRQGKNQFVFGEKE